MTFCQRYPAHSDVHGSHIKQHSEHPGQSCAATFFARPDLGYVTRIKKTLETLFV